jgi:hypothetical protein
MAGASPLVLKAREGDSRGTTGENSGSSRVPYPLVPAPTPFVSRLAAGTAVYFQAYPSPRGRR